MSLHNADELKFEKSRAKELFNRIYKRYDLLNHLLSFGLDVRWRKILAKALAAHLGAKRNIKILDLAAGTGDLSIAVSKRLPDAHIICADISENMLSRARMKFQKRNTENISFSIADAARLPFDNQSMDAVMVAFGVRNFPKLHQSLEECCRVLKDDGVLYVLEFGWPTNKIVSFFYRIFSVTLIPLLGQLIAGDKSAYAYLRETIRLFPYGNSFTEIIRSQGFRQASYRKLSGGIVYFYEASRTRTSLSEL